MKKLGITKNELLQMREQGLSNKDIANLLEISPQTVYRYIGPQQKHMDSLAAFVKTKGESVGQTSGESQKPAPKATDKLEVTYEIIKSAEGAFNAELDYESKSLSLCNSTIAFDKLPEFVTFVVGLAGRVSNHQEASRKAFE